MIIIPGSGSGNRQDETTDELLEDTVRKVREGIEAARRGEIHPIDEAEAMIRRELGIIPCRSDLQTRFEDRRGAPPLPSAFGGAPVPEPFLSLASLLLAR